MSLFYSFSLIPKNIFLQIFGIIPRLVVVFVAPLLLDDVGTAWILSSLVCLEITLPILDIGRNQGLLAGYRIDRIQNYFLVLLALILVSLVGHYQLKVNFFGLLVSAYVFYYFQRKSIHALRSTDITAYLTGIFLMYPLSLVVFQIQEFVSIPILIVLSIVFILLDFCQYQLELELPVFDLRNGIANAASSLSSGVAQRLDLVIVMTFLSSEMLVYSVQFNTMLGLLYLLSRLITNSALITGVGFLSSNKSPLVLLFLSCIVFVVFMVLASLFSNQLVLSSPVQTIMTIGLAVSIIPIRERIALCTNSGNVIPHFLFSVATLLSLATVYIFYWLNILSGTDVIAEFYVYPRVLMLLVGLYLIRCRLI